MSLDATVFDYADSVVAVCFLLITVERFLALTSNKYPRYQKIFERFP